MEELPKIPAAAATVETTKADIEQNPLSADANDDDADDNANDANADATSDADWEDKSCCGKLYNAFAGFLFPKITPIPQMSFIVLSLLVAVP
jgi:hypothetical protein